MSTQQPATTTSGTERPTDCGHTDVFVFRDEDGRRVCAWCATGEKR